MNTIVPFKKTLLAFSLVVSFIAAYADDKPKDHLVFTNPKLISGSQLQLHSVYQFKDVMPGIDANLSIDSLVGGATVATIDDNSDGVGYSDALQP